MGHPHFATRETSMAAFASLLHGPLPHGTPPGRSRSAGVTISLGRWDTHSQNSVPAGRSFPSWTRRTARRSKTCTCAGSTRTSRSSCEVSLAVRPSSTKTLAASTGRTWILPYWLVAENARVGSPARPTSEPATPRIGRYSSRRSSRRSATISASTPPRSSPIAAGGPCNCPTNASRSV